MKGWGPDFVAKRPEYTMDQVSQYLTNMYTKKADFVFTVPREFVKACKTPILVAPDDSPPHPYKVAMEVAMLSPNAQVTLYPWKEHARARPSGGAPHQDVPGDHNLALIAERRWSGVPWASGCLCAWSSFSIVCSRITNFWILPVMVIGNSGTNSM